MIITGIGSRQTPWDILDLFKDLGREIQERGWWVRSGHAEGADYAFELGAKKNCIVYLPWRGFNATKEIHGTPHYASFRQEVFDIVLEHEPHAAKLSDGVKLIKSRNVYQILGQDLATPSDLVICWTDEGKVVGGTGLAIKIARAYGIPIINVGSPEVEANLHSLLRDIITKIGV